jgi:hypothetical protein
MTVNKWNLLFENGRKERRCENEGSSIYLYIYKTIFRIKFIIKLKLKFTLVHLRMWVKSGFLCFHFMLFYAGLRNWKWNITIHQASPSFYYIKCFFSSLSAAYAEMSESGWEVRTEQNRTEQKETEENGKFSSSSRLCTVSNLFEDCFSKAFPYSLESIKLSSPAWPQETGRTFRTFFEDTHLSVSPTAEKPSTITTKTPRRNPLILVVIIAQHCKIAGWEKMENFFCFSFSLFYY